MRIALGVEYNGAPFCGWQEQKGHIPSVQSALEAALSFVANEKIKVVCAGRTDKGVHAMNQVVHFDTMVERSERSWLLGANSNLPRDVVVTWIEGVSDDFHARFSAKKRRYHYYIHNVPSRPAVFADQLTWHLQPLDAEKMHEAAQALIGEHDFSSFRAADCQAKTPIRKLCSISVKKQANLVLIDVTANAFLHHMVRNITGCLLAIGDGNHSVSWMKEVLLLKNRQLAGVTAPPNGLYLVNVEYPESLLKTKMNKTCFQPFNL